VEVIVADDVCGEADGFDRAQRRHRDGDRSRHDGAMRSTSSPRGASRAARRG
jgi:hypothetical protein